MGVHEIFRNSMFSGLLIIAGRVLKNISKNFLVI